MTRNAALLERFPQLREQYVAEGGVKPDEAANELVRFFDLTRHTSASLAMVSPRMDLMWHCFIRFTEDYGRFCEEEYGGFIHHRPRTAMTPVSDEAVRNFYVAYETHLGRIPDVWNEGVPAAVIDYGIGKVFDLSPAYRWSGWPGRC